MSLLSWHQPIYRLLVLEVCERKKSTRGGWTSHLRMKKNRRTEKKNKLSVECVRNKHERDHKVNEAIFPWLRAVINKDDVRLVECVIWIYNSVHWYLFVRLYWITRICFSDKWLIHVVSNISSYWMKRRKWKTKNQTQIQLIWRQFLNKSKCIWKVLFSK